MPTTPSQWCLMASLSSSNPHSHASHTFWLLTSWFLTSSNMYTWTMLRICTALPVFLLHFLVYPHENPCYIIIIFPLLKPSTPLLIFSSITMTLLNQNCRVWGKQVLWKTDSDLQARGLWGSALVILVLGDLTAWLSRQRSWTGRSLSNATMQMCHLICYVLKCCNEPHELSQVHVMLTGLF